ncbi:NADH-quinone oxidoreductase subunit L [secondary endosymbiont of Ctenarytaina eucalypti]|uniref:NADH-quinone oxidoreductase subunit L n=1 Tax=secondary endosymbiont of Ctenarytaina eucalypti TaxID=1199245 RepID=J3YS54_9ENTR|nr:NADH-quinone oxidoreductase subunit L [secondary endosymbiont of Ctenarytaina eucalypti]AFP84973.1 proton-translocating NADH-quinone oxidoreductase, chain L [secondary endosymbiont of Ctenarytaina eucalypti]
MNILYLIPLFPLMGFLFMVCPPARRSESLAAIVGVGSIGISAMTTVLVGLNFILDQGEESSVFSQTLWHWMMIGDFLIPITLSLDGLSLTMLSIITGVGFFIHLYASWYMHGEEGYARFFAYTNLFIASMTLLVLADNLLLMYLGWEVVGLCSYLLIGFYYSESKNGVAAMKAFIVTRIGDILLACALFILYDQLGTLNFHEITVCATEKLGEDSPMITLATLMLLGGAIAKSAQLPLQTWLPDAMVGPTPVSALIHAATMVTAGVYLIARTHALFLMAPVVLHVVAIIGTVTLLLAGFSALVQTDIKRVLAYSTMSQIGYMFLALGVQAWTAAIFHLMTHAFFKALLFLSSGSVIVACQYEHNIFKMGGLRKSLPLVYICFLVGGAALSSLPLVSAGFYSKDEILWRTMVNGHDVLILASLMGVFLTSLYTFRMIFIVFHGQAKIHPHACRGGISHHLPLIILIILSTCIGAWITPPLSEVFPASECSHEGKVAFGIISGAISIIGVVLAAGLWLGQSRLLTAISASAPGRFFTIWLLHGWGFDWLYDKLFVKPYLLIAQLLTSDPLNALMTLPAFLVRRGGRILTASENGEVRWYAISLVIGAIFVLAMLTFI